MHVGSKRPHSDVKDLIYFVLRQITQALGHNGIKSYVTVKTHDVGYSLRFFFQKRSDSSIRALCIRSINLRRLIWARKHGQYSLDMNSDEADMHS